MRQFVRILKINESTSSSSFFFWMNINIAISLNPRFLLGVGGEPPTKFSKRGSLTGSQFLEGGCWESFSVITKDLNWKFNKEFSYY